jgi:cytochrome P450
MAVLVHDLELLELPFGPGDEMDHETLYAGLSVLQGLNWLFKLPFGYVVLGHDDTATLLRDRRLHQAAGMAPALFGGGDTTVSALDDENLLNMEGPDHTRLRRILSPHFSPKAVAALRPFMANWAATAVASATESISGQGVVDIQKVFEMYPIAVIYELLGVGSQDWPSFSKWAETAFLGFSSESHLHAERIAAEMAEFDAYCVALVEDRRANPTDDLLGRLVAIEEAGDRLSNRELVVLISGLIAAGTDTTRNQIGNLMFLLSQRPELWARLRDHPEEIPLLVEESFRYLNPIRNILRQVAEPIEYRDVLFPEGTILAFSLSAAGRDAANFDDPQTFAADRSNAGDHLAFSQGVHYCLGAALSRVELYEVVFALTQGWSSVVAHEPPEWKSSNLAIWGPERVPLSVTV